MSALALLRARREGNALVGIALPDLAELRIFASFSTKKMERSNSLRFTRQVKTQSNPLGTSRNIQIDGIT